VGRPTRRTPVDRYRNQPLGSQRAPQSVCEPGAEEIRALFDAYIADDACLSQYRGQSIARNTCRNDWYYDLDLRLSQKLSGPGRFFGLEDRIRIYATIDNFLNRIDKSRNVRRSRGTRFS